jgi:hypothetical protein
MNHRSSNKGRLYNTIGLVNRLQVAKQNNFASIPSEDSPFTRSMQIGYWAIQLTIQREWRIKRPELKTENQQRSSTKDKDERDINQLSVYLQVIYRTTALEQMLFKKNSSLVVRNTRNGVTVRRHISDYLLLRLLSCLYKLYNNVPLQFTEG